jgi:hypothetical protein
MRYDNLRPTVWDSAVDLNETSGLDPGERACAPEGRQTSNLTRAKTTMALLVPGLALVVSIELSAAARAKRAWIAIAVAVGFGVAGACQLVRAFARG